MILFYEEIVPKHTHNHMQDEHIISDNLMIVLLLQINKICSRITDTLEAKHSLGKETYHNIILIVNQ